MRILIAWLGRATSFVLFHAPAGVRRALGDFLAFLWYDVFRIRRQVVLNNLAIAFPHMSPRERVRLGRRSLQCMGLNFVEYSFLPWLNRNNYQNIFRFENPELVERKLADGKGVLLMTLHLGHGDLACAAMSLRGWPVVMVSKFFKLKWLNDLWFGMRSRLGTRFIPPRDSSYALLKALKSGAAVVIPLDQFTGPPIGVRTRFFGHETGTAAGLAVMAERSGAPVLAVYTYRDADGTHVLHFDHEVEVPKNPGRDPEFAARVTQQFNDDLEQFVRRHPEQWMWIHKRWKRFVVH
jgi:KDO2-lipid IV(A) lauroyltransferase